MVRQRMLDVATETRTQGIEIVAEKSAIRNFPSPEQRKTSAENLEEVRSAVASSDQEGYARTCEMLVDASHVDPDYAKVTCPVVLVAGDLDIISPVQKSEDVCALLGGPAWIKVVESGHQLLISDTEATASAIVKLLEKV
jgi:3-oxoadipate enol-lactonase